MQSFAINIASTDKASIASAVDDAITKAADQLEDEVVEHLAILGSLLEGAVAEMHAAHVGAYIAGTHTAAPEDNTAQRESITISVYATSAAATADAQAAAIAPATDPVPAPAPPPADPGAMGASPIPTALQPNSVVPDGSVPLEGAPPEQVDANATPTPTVAEAQAAEGQLSLDAPETPPADAGVNSGESPAPATNSDAAASPAGEATPGSAPSGDGSAPDTGTAPSEAPGAPATPAPAPADPWASGASSASTTDSSAGASPIPTALGDPNAVPDGSQPAAPPVP